MNENPIVSNETQVQQGNVDWKKQFTTVTPLSKALAMLLLIALPFIGFWLGYQYGAVEQTEDVLVNQTSNEDSRVAPRAVFSTDFPLPAGDGLSWSIDSGEVPEFSLYVQVYNSDTQIPPQTLSGTIWKSTQVVGCDASPTYGGGDSEELSEYLLKNGWRWELVLKDVTLQGLEAGGPTGGIEGYVRVNGGVVQTMYVSHHIVESESCEYDPESTNVSIDPCPPWGGTCPFVYEYKVFLSNPVSLNEIIQAGGSRLPNPASQNCIQLGGTLEMRASKAGQYGVCLFEDNRQCEEWALLRGECPVGGLKVTGYENDAQVYCAITGGQVEGVGTETPMCKQIDGTYCTAQANLDGECPDPHDPNPSAGNVEAP